jgi:antitoxin ParD1/3/4
MEQSARDHALAAAIREGIESGVSDRTVPDIMKAVEARLRANGRLWTDSATDQRSK